MQELSNAVFSLDIPPPPRDIERRMYEFFEIRLSNAVFSLEIDATLEIVMAITTFVGVLLVFGLVMYAIWLLPRLRNLPSNRGKTIDFLRNDGQNQARSLKRDCNVETVYAMQDEQCDLVCQGPSVFRAKRGVCVNVLVFETRTVENKCSAKDGVLAYLVGNSEFGNTQMICMSVDVGVRPDDLNKPNTLCQGGGSIDIDYTKRFPSLDDCDCGEGKRLALIPATSTVRTRGVCVSNEIAPLFAHQNLLYQKTQ